MTDETPGSVPTPPPSYVAPQQPAAPAGYAQQQPHGAPQPYGQQPYAPQPYGQPGYYAPAKPTNTLAIVALILSLVSVIFGITAIGGIICGHIALSQIKRTGENGRGLALAGVIVGYVLVGIGILAAIGYVIFLVVIIGAAGASGGFR